MTTDRTTQIDTDFAIEIDYIKGEGDPTRVFRSMISMIDACERMDSALLAAIDVRLRPMITLEDLEAHSLKSLLRTLVENIPNDALLHLDPKPLFGQYLLMGKKRIIDWTNDKPTITKVTEIAPLVDELNKLTGQTNVAKLPGFSLVNPKAVLSSMAGISESLAMLNEGDTMMYASRAGNANFNSKFKLSSEDVENLLTEKSLTSQSTMFLKVKSPDFMGESKWQLKHGSTSLSATIEDKAWLAAYHNGEIPLLPIDTINVVMQTTLKYDNTNELIGARYAILKVLGVLPGASGHDQYLLTNGDKP